MAQVLEALSIISKLSFEGLIYDATHRPADAQPGVSISDWMSAPPPPPKAGPVTVPSDSGTVIVPGGSTVVTPESDVSVKEEKSQIVIVPGGANLGDLVRALNAMGVTPRDLISILQSIKATGALQADLEIM
jgi:hypothetical protein